MMTKAIGGDLKTAGLSENMEEKKRILICPNNMQVLKSKK